MTKLEIAQQLAERNRMPLADAIHAVDGITEIIGKAFAEGHSIFLRGFGTFRIVERKAKVVQNIKEKTSVQLPAHKTVKFTPSKLLTIKQ